MSVSSASARLFLLPLAYLLWFANAGMSLILVVLTRQLLLRLVVALRLGPWAMGALDKWALVALVLLWLAWIVVAEGSYRTAARRGPASLAATSWRTFLAVGLPLLAVGATLLLLRP